eukprot:6214519-Pleurochrysis_carterae.AAC.1
MTQKIHAGMHAVSMKFPPAVNTLPGKLDDATLGALIAGSHSNIARAENEPHSVQGRWQAMA